MITEERVYEDAEIMDGEIKEYLKRYAPAGYGTEVKINIIQSYEEWKQNKLKYMVTFTRYKSCD
jgi:hypothetical protein